MISAKTEVNELVVVPMQVRDAEAFIACEQKAREIHQECSIKDVDGNIVYDSNSFYPVYDTVKLENSHNDLEELFTVAAIPQGKDAWNSTLVVLGLATNYLEMVNGFGFGQAVENLQNGIVGPIKRKKTESKIATGFARTKAPRHKFMFKQFLK